MSDGGTVSALQATVLAAIEEVGKVQSALSLVKDRVQNTRDILTTGTDTSTRDEVASAQAALIAVDEIADQGIEATLIVIEQLTGYAGSV